ncbi:MAG: hypothetical protein HC877_23375 [Thioploca sp.]|nr:hypothetical protein [Thioploca sp.]
MRCFICNKYTFSEVRINDDVKPICGHHMRELERSDAVRFNIPIRNDIPPQARMQVSHSIKRLDMKKSCSICTQWVV